MTIIKGALEGKRLSLHQQSANEGEACEAQLEITLAPEDNVTYYLEFLCPYGRKYLSTALDVDNGVINYTLPKCVFLVAGKVYAQLVALKDSIVVFKSIKSSAAAIDILPSVNAAEQAEEQRGFLAEAEFTLSLAKEAIQSAQQKAEQMDEKTQELENIVRTLSASLANREFEGKSAYSYAVEGGFSGDEQEFAAVLARAQNSVEDVPESGNYLRVRGGWNQAVELPAPSLEKLGSVLTVTADGEQAKYTLSPVNGEAAVLDADGEELHELARLDQNSVFYAKRLISAEEALNGEGNYSIRFLFQGEIVVQIIEEQRRGIRYKRTKSGSGPYCSATVDPIIPIKIENVQLLPEMFVRKEHFFEARLNLKELCGLNIADGTMPIFNLAENSAMAAYECNLSKKIMLSGGRLIIRAAVSPETNIAGDIVLIGAN